MPQITIREGLLEEVLELQSKIPEFDAPYGRDHFENRYKGKEKLFLVAEEADVKVGFILAYDRDNDGSLYCWLAGVLPEYRKQGVFSLLMGNMDTWAREKGYNKIKVKTRNKFRQMLLFLVKNEFNFTLIEPAENILEYSIHVEKEL